jgi:hypothetical protein
MMPVHISSLEPDAPKDDAPEEFDTSELHAEFSPEPDETTSKLLIRYLQTVVAWNHAITYLNRSKLFRSGLGITLNIVHTPPSLATGRIEIHALLDEFLPQVISDPDSRAAVRVQLISKFNLPVFKNFGGTRHCEAILMGLIISYSQTADPNMSREFETLFEVTSLLFCRF